jgi:hypothetical protein
MPTLEDLSPSDNNRILCLGRSKSGKTGSLASLANAGFQLRIFDFDKGLAPLEHFVKPECKKNVEYKNFNDRLKLSRGRLVSRGNKGPTAFPELVEALDTWHDGIASWPSNVVAVFDSLTAIGQCILRYARFMAGQEGDHTSQPTWGVAMENLERLLEQLKFGEIRCSVIYLAHVTYLAGEGPNANDWLGLPIALGTKLPPKIPTYFNATLYYRSEGQGDNAKRLIYTRPRDGVETAFPVPAPTSLPIETGLATLFSLMGIKPEVGTPPTTGGPDQTTPSQTNP